LRQHDRLVQDAGRPVFVVDYLDSHTRQTLLSESVSSVEPGLSLLYPKRTGDQV
jgi:hypothetical protein